MKLPDLNLILNCHCKKATELASESLDRQLTASERWALRMHTLVCKSCRRAVRQLQALHRLAGQMPDAVKQAFGHDASELSPERKAEIAEAMRKLK
ncbi:zf-HC2 domain-containing protein [Aeoliella mucimassa]|uniref:Putative zinc-finger domain-containing protein n=1 Tax=Aeoliella mucimassa TaxID=2527972 RepID=A0A518AWH8_9BACT|nr:zf-HC2 domain-containing protein [Aeoliella mucimassa]QDU59051.1 hypothetical protein Pan181_52920 [Aeoliella mucimassa]